MLSQERMTESCCVQMEIWLIRGEDAMMREVSESNVPRVTIHATLSGKIQRGRSLSVQQTVINMVGGKETVTFNM